ncbi:hypothetical protein [Sporolactobacillus nakayamae]|uniref:hypothetical protein n=1 Tax=Sporolactobacillus nakayamae TaxID=269670 RepID=UPI001160249E|nr:hypothetical protein [Sporolactobacillus nakayamae]
MEVFKIQLEPTRIVKLPIITDLKFDQLIQSEAVNDHDDYYPYTIREGEHIFPKTFALDSLDVAICDYIGIKSYPIWVVEPRQMFIEGDRVILQTTDRRLFAGKSKLLTNHSLILRNNKDVNCEVIDFADIHFIGRFARGISIT